MITRAAPLYAHGIGSKAAHVKLSNKNIHVILPKKNVNVIMPDPNHGIKREVLATTKLKDRRVVTYELAVEKDTPLVSNFLQSFFITNESLGATVGLDADDAKAIAEVITPKLTYNVIAKVDENIVGVSCFAFEEHKEQTPLPDWPTDFGKLIDKGPTNRRKANVVLNYVFQCEKYTYHRVPAPSLLAHGAILSVHPAYQGQGIGLILDMSAYKQAYERGADYVINMNSSIATNLMSMNLPAQKLIQQCEFAKYVDYGTRPFENMIDGAKTNGIYTVDLKQSWPVYDKILKDAIQKRS
uniref:N-acetyltransferase domain-containing protein n=1 Tax=Panagrellus redivivus TaxID=6233 RepID=A0A7E4V9H6_PANRE